MKKIALLGALALSMLSPLAMADDAKPLRIGIEAAYPPFAFKTPEGAISGFDYDIGVALCGIDGEILDAGNGRDHAFPVQSISNVFIVVSPVCVQAWVVFSSAAGAGSASHGARAARNRPTSPRSRERRVGGMLLRNWSR